MQPNLLKLFFRFVKKLTPHANANQLICYFMGFAFFFSSQIAELKSFET